VSSSVQFYLGVVDTNMLKGIEVSEDAVGWRDGGCVRLSSVWDLSMGFTTNSSAKNLGWVLQLRTRFLGREIG
jgi:hypothetical protein